MTLTIHLDSIRKHRSTNEYRNVNRASCEGFESVGDGDNIKAVANMLIAANYSPNQAVSVFRGTTECFAPVELDKWASGTAFSGEQPEHLKKDQSK